MVYTTEKLLEILSYEGYKSFKKLNKNTKEYQSLQMKKPTLIAGKTYNCWKEYVNDKVVEYLNDNNINSFVNRDGQIELFVDDNEQQGLNRKLFSFMKKQKII